jgi:hypothetical protein
MTPDTLLERLDLALADDPGADADLLALVADVRAQAPAMSDEFAAALDERVAAGLAPRRAWLRMPNLFVMGPLGAAVAAAIVVVVVSTSGGGSPRPVVDAGPTRLEAHAPTLAKTAGGAAASSAGPALPAPESAQVAPSASAAPVPQAALGGTTTPAPGRRVELTTQLALSTTTDKVQATADGVVSATRQAGGFVSSSQVQIAGSEGDATFTLRIPAARLEPALTAFTRLAHVTSMSQSTQDITGQFATTNTRLTRLEGRLGTLRKGVQNPTTIAQENALAHEIAAQKSALSGLRHEADYVTVDLTITGHRAHHHAVVHHKGGGGFSVHRALHDAGRILEIGLGVLVIAAAILLPLGLLLGLAGLAARSLRRRTRESALKMS